MFNARDWLAANIQAAAGVSDQSWETVAGFALLWSLFEERMCGTEAKKDVLEDIARQYTARTLTNDMQSAYAYWVDRYLIAEGAATKFDELFDRLSGKADVQAILIDSSPALDRQVFALLMIVYRLRNNLFHGVKRIETFNDQGENLQMASRALASLLEHFGIH